MYMWKIKPIYGYVIFILAIASLLSGCNSKAPAMKGLNSDSQELLEDIIATENAVLINDAAENSHLTFAEVHKGDFIMTTTSRVNYYFPNYEEIYPEEGMSAIVVEILCNLYETVNEGDPLISIQYEVDQGKLEKMRLELLRSEEGYEEGRRGREQKLQEQRDYIDSLTDESIKHIERKRYESMVDEYESYIETTEEEIDELRVEVDAYQAKTEVSYIYSPITGVINGIPDKIPGDTITSETLLFTIYSLDKVYLIVDNSSENFRYNMEVDLIVTPSRTSRDTKKELHYKGRVISKTNLVSDDLKQQLAYIEILDYDISTEDMISMANMYVSAVCTDKHMENVLLVDKDAVMVEKGIPYVMVYDNGKIYRKNFVSGGVDLNNYYVFDGLSEGMTVLTY